MKIFLDDIREPATGGWTVVRNYNEFVKVATSANMITHMSFDHDLGESDEKTGYDAAKWFIEECIDNPVLGIYLEYITVHSANPVGKNNIYGIFRNAQKHGIIPSDVKID